MIIKFKDQVELDVVEKYYEEDDFVESFLVTLDKGAEEDVTVLEDREESIDLQFEDGSCCYEILKSCFETIE